MSQMVTGRLLRTFETAVHRARSPNQHPRASPAGLPTSVFGDGGRRARRAGPIRG